MYSLRLLPGERSAVEAAARRANLSTAEWVRRTLVAAAAAEAQSAVPAPVPAAPDARDDARAAPVAHPAHVVARATERVTATRVDEGEPHGDDCPCSECIHARIPSTCPPGCTCLVCQVEQLAAKRDGSQAAAI
jgi:hypothetical protein